MIESRNPSPRILHVSWGKLGVEGEAESYKDAKLFPGGSREWNWRETATSHNPGIQIADVQALAYKRNAWFVRRQLRWPERSDSAG